MAAIPGFADQLLHTEALVWAKPTLVEGNGFLAAHVAIARLYLAYWPTTTDPESLAHHELTRSRYEDFLSFVSSMTDLSWKAPPLYGGVLPATPDPKG